MRKILSRTAIAREPVAVAKKTRRGTSSPLEWTRLLGASLVVWAVALATSKDYPVPSDASAQGSATRASGLLHRPIGPRGDSPADQLEWAWNAPEAPWELVIFDADLEEVYRATCPPGRPFRAPAEVLELLGGGQEHYWQIRLALYGSVVRSSPVLFRAVP